MVALKIIWLLAFLLSALNLISACKEHMGFTESDDTTDATDPSKEQQNNARYHYS